MSRPDPFLRFLRLLALALLGILGSISPAMATTVTAANGLSCAGDRTTNNKSLGCNAGEFTTIVNITNEPGSPTSCVAGDYVTLIGSVGLAGTNADRYNVGFFTGEDGNDPKEYGTGKLCSVATFPTSPLPWFAYNTDACGDYKAAGVDNPVINNIKVLCAGDASGKLMVPYTLVYSQSNYTCTGPIDVVASNSAKCNAGTAVVDAATFTVNGSVTVTKQTIPDGDAQSFSFTASGSGPVMSGDSAFSLVDNGSKPVRMGISGTARTLTITEAATALWEPTATIACTRPDGSSSAGFVVTNGATRTITATLSNTNPNAVCTITNKRAVSATNSTVVANPTSVVNNGVSTSTITVTLRDTSAAGNPVAGKTVTLAAGSGSSVITTLNGVTDVNGRATFTVKDAVAEAVTYTATDTTDGITIAQTTTVTFYAPASDFNAFETSTAAGAIAGAIKTKIAGSGFGLDVVAISGGAQSSSFSNAVKVELLGNTTTGIGLDANNCPTSYTLLQTVSPNPAISSGRSTVNFAAVSNAWKDVRVRISFPADSPTVTSCSTDNFTIRPNALVAYASHNDWETAGTAVTLDNAGTSGAPIHKAGRDFTLVATGYNTASGVTTNYNGIPTAANVAAVAPAAVTGNFSVGAFSAPGPANGTVRSDTATYDEVGPVSLILQDQGFASVDASDTAGDCSATGRYVCSAAFNVGRFVPDSFSIAITDHGTFADNCPTCTSAFTYLGDSFTYGDNPTVTITARNASGGVTQNYTGSFARLLTSPTIALTYPTADTTQDNAAGTAKLGITSSPGTASLSDNGDGTLIYTLGGGSADNFTYDRELVAPFTPDLTIIFDSVNDGDISTTFSSGNAITPAANHQRYGRLTPSNGFGPEYSDVYMPLLAEYYNGVSFIINSDDVYTTGITLSITMVTATDNSTLALADICVWDTGNPGSSGIGCSIVSAADKQFSEPPTNGNFNLWFQGPGAGKTGTVDILADVPAWLEYDWYGIGDEDPTGVITFGIYQGDVRFHDWREVD
jgi:hypothetical protein